MSAVRVVVTGMGAVTAIGIGAEAFTEGLRTGRSAIRLLSHFDAGTFPNRLAAEIDDSSLEPSLERLSAGERAWLACDRKALLVAIATDLAMEDAGAIAAAPFDRGVSFGPGIDYADFARSLRATPDPQAALPVRTSFWGIRDDGGQPTRIPFDAPTRWASDRYGFKGSLLTNIGACAAGAMAVGEAFRQVRRGSAQVMLAGGFDSMINPLGLMGFSLLGALSGRTADPARASRPFDIARDGFVPGEGAGVLVLESLEHARGRGARIYAEIAGYGASMDAHRPTAPAPGGRGAAMAMRRALDEAGWAPEQVDYVNAHGTSTPLNDPAETQAIKHALGAHATRIPVSSTKSQIGHLVAGAGAVELIGSILSMNAGFVPPTLNLDHPDPACDLDYVPHVSRPLQFERLLSNSFGFGGQNACIAASRYEDS